VLEPKGKWVANTVTGARQLSLKKIPFALALAGIVMAGVVASVTAQDVMVNPAIATMTPDVLVETRQEIMKQNGGTLRNIGGMSGADAVAAADTLIQNFTDLPALFAPDSIVGDSKALPLIWQEKEAFDAIFAQAKTHAMEIKAAAEAGDAAAIGAAAQAIGGLCGACHSKYRA
jgi:cytochrome c556